MTEPHASDDTVSRSPSADDRLPLVVVYVLYLLGWAFGLTAAVGFVMAYALKERAPDWVRTHYVFLIRTGWFGMIGLLTAGFLAVLGAPLTLILVGFLVWKIAAGLAMAVGIWVTVRCVIGMTYALRCEPYPRPRTLIV